MADRLLPAIIDKRKHMLVVKSNMVTREARYSLSTREQKLLHFFLSFISPDATGEETYSVSIRELCEVFGLDLRSNYSSIKAAVKKLHDSSFWLPVEDGEVLVTWLSKARIHSSTEQIDIKFDKDFLPYIIALKASGNYTQYELENVVHFSCKYSFRLYDLCKSWQNLGFFSVTLDELRSLLMLGNKYTKFADFRRYVLEPAIKEINENTDIFVDYSAINRGLQIGEIQFSIAKPIPIERVSPPEN